MDITNVKALYFTGAGTTKQATERFVQACGLPADLFDVTPFGAEVPTCTAHDLAVFAVPSYGGRIPAPMAERISRISGDNTPAVLLVTYGNRAIDDTLIELADAVSERGCIPVAGCAVVAHHSLMVNVAEGRPDADDLAVLDACAASVVERLGAAATVRDAELGTIPGNRPYRAFGGVPFHPRRHPMCASAAEPVLRNAPCGQSTPLHRAPPISSAAFRACAASPPARWGHVASPAVTRLTVARTAFAKKMRPAAGKLHGHVGIAEPRLSRAHAPHRRGLRRTRGTTRRQRSP